MMEEEADLPNEGIAELQRMVQQELQERPLFDRRIAVLLASDSLDKDRSPPPPPTSTPPALPIPPVPTTTIATETQTTAIA